MWQKGSSLSAVWCAQANLSVKKHINVDSLSHLPCVQCGSESHTTNCHNCYHPISSGTLLANCSWMVLHLDQCWEPSSKVRNLLQVKSREWAEVLDDYFRSGINWCWGNRSSTTSMTVQAMRKCTTTCNSGVQEDRSTQEHAWGYSRWTFGRGKNTTLYQREILLARLSQWCMRLVKNMLLMCIQENSCS